jgi:ATP-binding cassette, subfamily F, member 3
MKERNVVLGYLPQESAPAGDETVVELATAITPEFVKLRRIIKAWEADHPVEAMHPEEIHDNAHDRFNELGGYQLDAKAKQILAGLGFRDGFRPAGARDERRLGHARAPRAAARAGAGPADARRADEPSRPRSAALVSGLSENYPGAILVISHDREFLNQLVGSIVEIRQSKLIRYRGNYDEFLVQRAAAEEQLLAAYKNQQREIGRCRSSPTVSAPRPPRRRRRKASSSRSSAWTKSRRR